MWHQGMHVAPICIGFVCMRQEPWRLLCRLVGCANSIGVSVEKNGYFGIFFENLVILEFYLKKTGYLKKISPIGWISKLKKKEKIKRDHVLKIEEKTRFWFSVTNPLALVFRLFWSFLSKLSKKKWPLLKTKRTIPSLSYSFCRFLESPFSFSRKRSSSHKPIVATSFTTSYNRTIAPSTMKTHPSIFSLWPFVTSSNHP